MVLRLLLFLFLPVLGIAQTIPNYRTAAWERAGTTTFLQAPTSVIDIMDAGGINDLSESNNAVVDAAILQLNGNSGTIFFPDGDYLFEETVSLPDSTWLVGESSNAKLIFQLNGVGNAIQMVGSQTTDTLWINLEAQKGATSISVVSLENLQADDLLRIGMNDQDLVTSSWAEGFVGQMVSVAGINGNELVLSDPLNLGLTMDRSPFAIRIIPRKSCGIECLTIERQDNANAHLMNIAISKATDCVVRSVSSLMADFAHIGISSSCHATVENCYFKNAINYGGGGQGYGVSVQYATSFCLVENNIFEHLRHSMLLQAGSNANVFGYNYSRDPFWVESGLPDNAAGDLVLHGNYPYLNLFEGNVVQNMIIDASHGINGPHNTFFRNRVELYGIFIDQNTPSDSLNFVGNEVTLSGFPFGNYALTGAGHFEYGNNIFGAAEPVGTENLTDTSLYRQTPLDDFDVWPLIGYPNAIGTHAIPAQDHFTEGSFTGCTEPLITTIERSTSVSVWQDMAGTVHIPASMLPCSIRLFDLQGRQVSTRFMYTEKLSFPYLSGVFILEVAGKNGDRQNLKVRF